MTQAYAAAKKVGIWLGLPVVLVTVWWFASAGSVDFYRPSLQRIMQAFVETWWGPRFFQEAVPSMARLAAGYTLALILDLVPR